MGKDLLFWVLMLFWAVLGVAGTRLDASTPNGRYVLWGGNLLLFLLFLVLGWTVYGAPLK